MNCFEQLKIAVDEHREILCGRKFPHAYTYLQNFSQFTKDITNRHGLYAIYDWHKTKINADERLTVFIKSLTLSCLRALYRNYYKKCKFFIYKDLQSVKTGLLGSSCSSLVSIEKCIRAQKQNGDLVFWNFMTNYYTKCIKEQSIQMLDKIYNDCLNNVPWDSIPKDLHTATLAAMQKIRNHRQGRITAKRLKEST